MEWFLTSNLNNITNWQNRLKTDTYDFIVANLYLTYFTSTALCATCQKVVKLQWLKNIYRIMYSDINPLRLCLVYMSVGNES